MGNLQETAPQAIDEEEKPDSKKDLREKVNLVLPDNLMIVLAGIMVPIVLVPLLVDLPEALDETFRFADYTILGIFIIEYFLKAVLAHNILKHVFNPWHLLDLTVVLLPLVSLLPFVAAEFGVSSPLLRLVRIARILAVSGRAADRRLKMASSNAAPHVEEALPMVINVMDGNLENIHQKVKFDKLSECLNSPSQTWTDICSVSEADFDRLSQTLGIPRLVLESELVDESYPRIDYFEHYSMIFARIAEIRLKEHGPARLQVDQSGLLVICQRQNIITLSKTPTSVFNLLLEKAKKIHTAQEPVVVSILYALLKYILEKDKQIIAAVELELMTLENIPARERPPKFLETAFHLRKEVNQLVPSLLHLKEIIAVITSKRVPLEGFSEKHAKIFDILMDEASYLHETASNARDNLQSLVDLYINTTSYEMNKVMRLIAVITSLGIIPAIILGGFGTNLIGNPWDIHLWQVFAGLGIAMLALGWIFYRLGWLKS